MVTLSYTAMDGYTKESRVKLTYYTNTITTPFENLTSLLNKDYVYSPFLYLGGKRLEANIISTANFVVIDVDDTSIPIFDMHMQLVEEQLNHIISTTSASSNLQRYRILIPISRPVDSSYYRNLVRGIQINGLIPDMDISTSVKPSQPFYSYKDSQMYSYYSGSDLTVEDYYVEPEEYTTLVFDSKDQSEISRLLVQKFSNPRFGKGLDSLVSAAFTLIESGATREQLEHCILAINQNWLVPMNTHTVYSSVIRPMQSRIN